MLHAVVNPAGASGRTFEDWKAAEVILRRRHAEYDVTFSTRTHSIEQIVSELTGTGENTDLLIMGGDGTMNGAVNGIRDFDKVRLGFLPCGSGNDLALSLGIPKDIPANIEKILEGKVRRELDIGVTTLFDIADKDGKPLQRRFNISSGLGFDAAICQEVETSLMKEKLNRIHLGKLVYIAVALNLIFTTEKTKARLITADHTVQDMNLLFAVAMNTRYEGGGFMFGPDAKPDDALLDICAADDLSQWDFFRIFPYAYSGSHVKFKGVSMRKTADCELITETAKWVHTDGEPIGMSAHVGWSLAEGRLQLLQ